MISDEMGLSYFILQFVIKQASWPRGEWRVEAAVLEGVGTAWALRLSGLSAKNPRGRQMRFFYLCMAAGCSKTGLRVHVSHCRMRHMGTAWRSSASLMVPIADGPQDPVGP